MLCPRELIEPFSPHKPTTNAICWQKQIKFALAQAAQGGCGVSFSGDIPAPPGRGAVQPALGDPASAGGLD